MAYRSLCDILGTLSASRRLFDGQGATPLLAWQVGQWEKALHLLEEWTDDPELQNPKPQLVAEAPWSVADWAVALRFDHPRATVPVLVLG